MAPLPVSCMKAVYQLTGFWGAYPLSQELVPGAYGRRVKGRFSRDGQLSDFAGYDPAAFAVAEAASRSPADAWLSAGTSVEQVAVSVEGPALPVGGRVRLRFSQAQQAAFACRNGRMQEFTNLRRVKDHVLELYQAGQWDRRDILITQVMKTDAAWLFYSSESGQSVDLSVTATPGPAIAADLLKAVIGSAQAETGVGILDWSGYSSRLDEPGTPLFQAIAVRRFPRLRAVQKGGDSGEFESVTFGDPDQDEDEE